MKRTATIGKCVCGYNTVLLHIQPDYKGHLQVCVCVCVCMCKRVESCAFVCAHMLSLHFKQAAHMIYTVRVTSIWAQLTSASADLTSAGVRQPARGRAHRQLDAGAHVAAKHRQETGGGSESEQVRPRLFEFHFRFPSCLTVKINLSILFSFLSSL